MSIYSLIKESTKKFGDKPALSTKNEKGTYKPISYKDLEGMVDLFASGMIRLGVNPKGDKEYGERVAIMSENRAEFIIADLANYALGSVTVPIYTTYTPKKIKEILEDSGAETVIVSTKDNYSKLAEALDTKEVSIKRLIIMDDVTNITPSNYTPHSFYFKNVIDMGKISMHDIKSISQSVKDEDLALLMYTSGTTGQPKGAMLTHNNIMSNIKALDKAFQNIGPGARALSIIPYSHAFEHTGTLTLLYKGVEIGFAESTETVAADLMNFKPSIMLAVPRLYEKVLDKIKTGLAASKVKRKIFNTAMNTKEKYIKKIEEGKKPGKVLSFMNKKLDHMVFEKIRQKTGGNLELCITGGGPLSPEIEDLFSRKIGIALYNGYGLTETSPVVSANTPEHHKKGTIGKPISDADVQIINGEIAASGPMVFKGYWKDEEKTKKAFTVKNGKTYFLTGDKGKLDSEGYLYIMGRMKNDIRLSTGQNIGLAEELEEPLLASVLISQVMIHGQAEPYITGLIVPNFEYLKATNTFDGKNKDSKLEELLKSMPDLTPEHPVPFKERLACATSKKTYELLTKTINDANKKTGMEDYASLKKFIILPSEFTEKSGLLTPTMKLKRGQVLKHYKPLFDKLYGK